MARATAIAATGARRRRTSRAGLLAYAVALSSTGCDRYWVCDEVDDDRVSEAPQRLSETGLFADIGRESLARLLEKLGPGDDWVALAYLWRTDQSDADAAPFGTIDAAGTPHDIPASNECTACHGGRQSFALGFSAIQLTSLPEGELDLAALVAADLVTTTAAGSFEVPGTQTERAALGYLHANCSQCHNRNRPARSEARCFDPENELDFSLSVNALGAPAETATYRSAVGSVVEPGRPGESRLIELVSRRGFGKQMPPLASERVDGDAVILLERWIRETTGAMKGWKSRLAVGVAVLKVTIAHETRAEAQGTPPAATGSSAPRANLSLGVGFGVSTAPFYTADFPSVRGHGFVAVLSGRYPISATEELGLALPGALISIEQPAGAYIDELTWGNPTLFLTHSRASDGGDGRAFRWFASVGVSLPLAEHGAPGALLSNRALAVASALEGWRDQESYFPGRLVTPMIMPSDSRRLSTPGSTCRSRRGWSPA